MKTTLQTRLLCGIGAASGVVLVTSMVLLFGSIRRTLTSEFDELLASRARSLISLTEQSGDTLTLGFHEQPMPEFVRNLRPEYYCVFVDDGEILARSRRLTTNLPSLAGSRTAPQFASLKLPDGRPGRAVGIRFLPHVDGETLSHPLTDKEGEQGEDEDSDDVDFSSRQAITLVVARETRPIDESVAAIGWLLLATGIGTLCTLFALLTWIVRRNLAPLRTIARRIESVTEDSLHERIELIDAPIEVDVVAGRLNELIARLETAFHREKTFTADMAHELRTPLAGIRATLEVALRRERSPESYQGSLRQCLSICSETQQIVAALLALARVESGRETVERSLVDVELVLRNTWNQFAALADDRRLAVNWNCAAGVFLATDAQQFRVIVSNLFRNAVDYADEGSTVAVASLSSMTCLRIVISNPCRSASGTDAEHAFQQFWRRDAARAQTGTHAGLGLALCQKIVAVLGGSISATSANGVFEILLEFPAELVDRTPADEPADSASDEPCLPVEDSQMVGTSASMLRKNQS